MAKATARKKANPQCKTNPTKKRKGHKGKWTCTSKSSGKVVKASKKPAKARKGKKRTTKRAGCKQVCKCVKR